MRNIILKQNEQAGMTDKSVDESTSQQIVATILLIIFVPISLAFCFLFLGEYSNHEEISMMFYIYAVLAAVSASVCIGCDSYLSYPTETSGTRPKMRIRNETILGDDKRGIQ